MSRRNHNLFDEPRQTNGETSRLYSPDERERKKSNRRFYCLCAVIATVTGVTIVIVLGVSLGLSRVVNKLPDDPYDRAVALLTEYPLIDG